jgi:hypothetical protein
MGEHVHQRILRDNPYWGEGEKIHLLCNLCIITRIC